MLTVDKRFRNFPKCAKNGSFIKIDALFLAALADFPN